MSELIPVTEHTRELWYISIILCCIGFVGFAGLHRFYTGKSFTGCVWILTCGLFGIGTIIDLFTILMGNYRCKDGSPLFITKS